jgi:hypothetical protein
VSGYVEAGYTAVTVALGGYAITLLVRVRKVRDRLARLERGGIDDHR